MVLRWVVGNVLRRAAHEKVAEVVAEAARGKATAGPQAADDETAPPCDVGIVFALGIEAGGLLDRLSGVVTNRGKGFVAHEGSLVGRRVVAMVSGPGRAAAERATEALIAGHRPKWVVSSGFAGALVKDLERGDLVLANQIMDSGGGRLSIDFRLEETPGVHVGRLLTVDRIVRKADERRRLADEHDAMAVDMETFAVAEVCRRVKIRFLSIRVISDALDDELPEDIEHLMQQKNLAGRAGAVTGAVFRRPSSLKDMWRLKETAVVGSDRLANFLAETLGQLGS